MQSCAIDLRPVVGLVLQKGKRGAAATLGRREIVTFCDHIFSRNGPQATVAKVCCQ